MNGNSQRFLDIFALTGKMIIALLIDRTNESNKIHGS